MKEDVNILIKYARSVVVGWSIVISFMEYIKLHIKNSFL